MSPIISFPPPLFFFKGTLGSFPGRSFPTYRTFPALSELPEVAATGPEPLESTRNRSALLSGSVAPIIFPFFGGCQKLKMVFPKNVAFFQGH